MYILYGWQISCIIWNSNYYISLIYSVFLLHKTRCISLNIQFIHLSLIKIERQEQVVTSNFSMDHGDGLYNINLLCAVYANQ